MKTVGFIIIAISLLFVPNSFSQNRKMRGVVAEPFASPSRTTSPLRIGYPHWKLDFEIRMPSNWFEAAATPYPNVLPMAESDMYTPNNALTREAIQNRRNNFGRVKLEDKFVIENATRGVIWGLAETPVGAAATAANIHFRDLNRSYPFLMQKGKLRKVYFAGRDGWEADFTGINPKTRSIEKRRVYVILITPPVSAKAVMFFLEVFAPTNEFPEYQQAAETILGSVRLTWNEFKEHNYLLDGRNFNLRSCHMNLGFVRCFLFLWFPFQSSDVRVRILTSNGKQNGESRLFDSSGNKYHLTNASFSNQGSEALVVGDQAITAVLDFDSKDKYSQITLLELWVSVDGSVPKRIEFRGITIE